VFKSLVQRPARTLLFGGLAALAVLAPFLIDTAWIGIAVFALCAGIGAMALNLLVGTSGQLSLAQPFFLVVGAYAYVLFASPSVAGVASQSAGAKGFNLPTLVAALLAIVLAGVCGLMFSPISSRLSGIYLGVASLALVFLGQHVVQSATNVTGGFTGRDVPPLNVFGMRLVDTPTDPTFLGHAFGKLERLYLVCLIALVAVAWIVRNIVRGRPGLALQALRDNSVSASVMGVDVRRYKAMAFGVSGMIAGAAGVLLAQGFGHIVPDNWDFDLAILYLAMIVIGGMGSVGGSVMGAFFVTLLPFLLNRYADKIPGLITGTKTGGWATPGQLAAYIFGFFIVGLLLFEPGGLAAVFRRIGHGRRSRPNVAPSEPPTTSPNTDSLQLTNQ
jgi:branched-chain amino acid transport system permease protein